MLGSRQHLVSHRRAWFRRMALLVAAVMIAAIALVAPRATVMASTTFGEWTGGLTLVHDDAFGEVHFTQAITFGSRVSGDDTTYISTYAADSQWAGSIVTYASHGANVCDVTGGNCHFVPDYCLVTTRGSASGNAQLFIDITTQQISGLFHYRISSDNLVIVTLPTTTTDSCGLPSYDGTYNFILSPNWGRLAPELGVPGLIADNAIKLEGQLTRAQTSDGAYFDDGWLISYVLTRTSSLIGPGCSHVTLVLSVNHELLSLPQPNGCWSWEKPHGKIVGVDSLGPSTMCNFSNPTPVRPSTQKWVYDDVNIGPNGHRLALERAALTACRLLAAGASPSTTTGYVYMAATTPDIGWIDPIRRSAALGTRGGRVEFFAELYHANQLGTAAKAGWVPSIGWPMANIGRAIPQQTQLSTSALYDLVLDLCRKTPANGYLGLYSNGDIVMGADNNGKPIWAVKANTVDTVSRAMNDCTTL
jgi:hypothetical protein